MSPEISGIAIVPPGCMSGAPAALARPAPCKGCDPAPPAVVRKGNAPRNSSSRAAQVPLRLEQLNAAYGDGPDEEERAFMRFGQEQMRRILAEEDSRETA